MGTYAKFISKTKIEENLFEIKHHILHNGICQCFKDCDCYNKKGDFLYEDTRYSNDIVLNPIGKPRTYSSINACKESLQAYLKKQN